MTQNDEQVDVSEQLKVYEETVTSLQTSVAKLQEEVQQLRKQLSPLVPEGASEEVVKGKQPYMDWWPQTLSAYQTTIRELVRVHTNNATVDVVALSAIRVLLDKEIITLEEVANLTDDAQILGLELIGISFQNVDPNAELSAEERYAQEGLEEWDGQRIGPS